MQEKSGLHLRELSTKASYGPKAMEFVDLYLATNRSVVRDYLKFEYNSMKDFSDFIRQVHVIGNLVESYVDSRDIEFFALNIFFFEVTWTYHLNLFSFNGSFNTFASYCIKIL